MVASVKLRRIEPGVYETEDGRHRIVRRSRDGHVATWWDLEERTLNGGWCHGRTLGSTLRVARMRLAKIVS